MKNLFMLVGCPGSGKSTWIRNHMETFDGHTFVVSRDEIRFCLVPEGDEYFSRETEVFNKFIDDIKFGLRNADNVIADATHLNESSRGKVLRRLSEDLKDVKVNAIVVRVPVKVALAQNENRKGTRSYVPESVIRRMHSQMTMPSIEEGFDKIYIYRPEADVKYTVIEEVR